MDATKIQLPLTLDEVNAAIERLETAPRWLNSNFTIEEAKRYLSDEYIAYHKLTTDADIIFYANGISDFWYPIDRDFLIQCYKIIKDTMLSEQKIEIARERLNLMGGKF